MKMQHRSGLAASLPILLAPLLSYGELVLRPVTVAERKSAATGRASTRKQ